MEYLFFLPTLSERKMSNYLPTKKLRQLKIETIIEGYMLGKKKLGTDTKRNGCKI
uniref:Uncharacterized protein n=1 Tax=Arion vulgaris TaxID=1028688 RepID=A0A0B6Y6H5_9EUPU